MTCGAVRYPGGLIVDQPVQMSWTQQPVELTLLHDHLAARTIIGTNSAKRTPLRSRVIRPNELAEQLPFSLPLYSKALRPAFCSHAFVNPYIHCERMTPA